MEKKYLKFIFCRETAAEIFAFLKKIKNGISKIIFVPPQNKKNFRAAAAEIARKTVRGMNAENSKNVAVGGISVAVAKPFLIEKFAILENLLVERAKKNLRKYRGIKKIADAPADKNEKISRFEYARAAFAKSKILPADLQKTLPFVPFQESAYKTSLRKNRAGAIGAWQFIYSTGKKFGLCGKNFDRRRDFKKSTDAAVKYFEEIFTELKNCDEYKNLQKKFGVDGKKFLSLATCNAFNSGELHMKLAMKFMAQKNCGDEKTLQKYFSESGENGLFLYMTKKYIYFYKTWQKKNGIRPPYYFRESADYVFQIKSYEYIFEKKFSAPQKEQKFENSDAFLLGALSPEILRFLIFCTKIKKNSAPKNEKNRREFLTATKNYFQKLFFRGVGGVLENNFNLAKNSFLAAGDFLHELSEKNFNSGLQKINSPEIAEKKFEKKIKKITKIKNPFRQKKYSRVQKIADRAFEFYKKFSDTDFLEISFYFYSRAKFLAQQQKKRAPGFALPRGGIREVDKRIKYVNSALEIVENDF